MRLRHQSTKACLEYGEGSESCAIKTPREDAIARDHPSGINRRKQWGAARESLEEADSQSFVDRGIQEHPGRGQQVDLVSLVHMAEETNIRREVGRPPCPGTVVVGLACQQEFDVAEAACQLDGQPWPLVGIESSEERYARMRALGDASGTEIDRVRQQIERVDPHVDHALQLPAKVQSGAGEEERSSPASRVASNATQ
jgi:hypothetical protein